MAITIHNRHRILGREWWTTEWAGLSTDDKATIEDVKVNDLFFEEDTGDFYYCEQAGSSSVIRTEVLEEMQFQATYKDGDYFRYFLNEIGFEDGLDEDSYFVKYDGQVYEVNKVSSYSYNYYGSESYPFFLESHYDARDGFWTTKICVLNTDEHTLEIYTEETVVTEAVWKKVGSGGSEPEPSGEKLFDGDVTTVEDNGIFMYEFSPMLALNYSSIIVEFDGTRYTVQNYRDGVNFYAFGTEMNNPFDFDEYPFGLVFGDNGNHGLATHIFTESSGTYSLKIWANSEEGEMPVPVPPLR